MTPLLPEQAEALRELAALWAERPFVLIGATAFGCWLDQRRPTEDIDLVVACDMEEFPSGVDHLTGWRRGQHEHQWFSPRGVRLDILPAGPGLLATGGVRWGSGAVMSLAGMRLAFRHAVPRTDLAENLTLRVPPLHVLVLLKMTSYLDNPARRTKDLPDLIHALRNGVPRHEAITTETVVAGIDYEHGSAFLLGARLRPLVEGGDLSMVESFLSGLLATEGSNPMFDAMLRAETRRGDESDDEDIVA